MLEIGDGLYLENNKEYVIIDIISYNDKTYLVLSGVEDIKDIVVRILDGENLIGLSTTEELNEVLKIYMDKKQD